MRKVILLFLLLLAPSVAHAQAVSATLSTKDHADVARIEAYLNNLKNIAATFLQVDEAGGFLRGDIAIQRPGKMKVTYAPPNKDFIVADGNMVHIWNDDLQAQTNVEEDASLASFILRDPVKLSGDVVVTKFKRAPAKLEVTLVEAEDPASGELTLVFEDNPLQLRQWRVLDPQGHVTGVSLENIREDVTFAPKTFTFVPPTFGKAPKGG